MIVLKTQRLLLRPVSRNDLEDLATLNANPVVMKFCGGSKTHENTKKLFEQKIDWDGQNWTRDINKQMLRYWDEQNGWNGYLSSGLWAKIFKADWAISYKTDNKFIGECGLTFHTVDGLKEVGIDYKLTEEYWGQGLATEAASTLRDYGFYELGVSRLISVIHPENIGSIKVAVKNGMTKSATKWKGIFDVYIIEKTAQNLHL